MSRENEQLTRPSTDIVLRKGDIGTPLEGDGAMGPAEAGKTQVNKISALRGVSDNVLNIYSSTCLLSSPTCLNRSEAIRFVEGRSSLQLPGFNLVETGWRGTTFS